MNAGYSLHPVTKATSSCMQEVPPRGDLLRDWPPETVPCVRTMPSRGPEPSWRPGSGSHHSQCKPTGRERQKCPEQCFQNLSSSQHPPSSSRQQILIWSQNILQWPQASAVCHDIDGYRELSFHSASSEAVTNPWKSLE